VAVDEIPPIDKQAKEEMRAVRIAVNWRSRGNFIAVLRYEIDIAVILPV
jgi:hypothetical protein